MRHLVASRSRGKAHGPKPILLLDFIGRMLVASSAQICSDNYRFELKDYQITHMSKCEEVKSYLLSLAMGRLS